MNDMVMVIGAGGQLGTDLVRVLGDRAVHVYHSDGEYVRKSGEWPSLDIRNIEDLRQVIGEMSPEWVINCAAFHNVDLCEGEPEEAFEVNAVGAMNVARVAEENDAIAVFISTDYVFSHEGPWDERDNPNPLSTYGFSKLAGEQLTTLHNPLSLIARVAGLFGVAGSSGKGGNFVETMVRLGRKKKRLEVVDDLILSPTYTLHAAQKLIELIDDDFAGTTVHITNDGACTWREFAEEIFSQLSMDVEVGSCKSADRDLATRPANGALTHLPNSWLGIQPMPSWQDALHEYLIEKGYLL